MSAIPVPQIPAPAPGPDGGQRGPRPLTDGEHAAVMAVAAATAGFALVGFVNSFAAVSRAAEPSFGALAPTVPLGIDLGIAIFAALDIVLARLDMRPKWVRLVPWALTAATIYLNVAGQHTWFGRIAHAVFPALWVMAVEAGAHVIRVRAKLATGTAMDRIRVSRWLLAPVPTFGLWRRMVLWEIPVQARPAPRPRPGQLRGHRCGHPPGHHCGQGPGHRSATAPGTAPGGDGHGGGQARGQPPRHDDR